jgi:hypothetical protein
MPVIKGIGAMIFILDKFHFEKNKTDKTVPIKNRDAKFDFELL